MKYNQSVFVKHFEAIRWKEVYKLQIATIALTLLPRDLQTEPGPHIFRYTQI